MQNRHVEVLVKGVALMDSGKLRFLQSLLVPELSACWIVPRSRTAEQQQMVLTGCLYLEVTDI